MSTIRVVVISDASFGNARNALSIRIPDINGGRRGKRKCSYYGSNRC